MGFFDDIKSGLRSGFSAVPDSVRASNTEYERNTGNTGAAANVKGGYYNFNPAGAEPVFDLSGLRDWYESGRTQDIGTPGGSQVAAPARIAAPTNQPASTAPVAALPARVAAPMTSDDMTAIALRNSGQAGKSTAQLSGGAPSGVASVAAPYNPAAVDAQYAAQAAQQSRDAAVLDRKTRIAGVDKAMAENMQNQRIAMAEMNRPWWAGGTPDSAAAAGRTLAMLQKQADELGKQSTSINTLEGTLYTGDSSIAGHQVTAGASRYAADQGRLASQYTADSTKTLHDAQANLYNEQAKNVPDKETIAQEQRRARVDAAVIKGMEDFVKAKPDATEQDKADHLTLLKSYLDGGTYVPGTPAKPETGSLWWKQPPVAAVPARVVPNNVGGVDTRTAMGLMAKYGNDPEKARAAYLRGER